ncbi:TetR/AcrR family transcriptional regulator [Arthrobacter sp. ISL-72]|uniref:TetR/AcrR family transcriptional regulator n=1 Tax=Arthrobacter sp. ISL-72 TaxID=2819114 RepID=UPI001BE65EFE|nr:TetR/AcrR family transcriptional regulator [Arthrobacter sp. ISL-72]MBT2597529.1 TetR/AcrR family transcriptional regulator [Arthrobacter sp. ISL-72]
MGRPKEFDPETAVVQAMNLFWRQGYASTTPQGLADALGIGKGSLYNAFGGKRQLFDLALQRYLDTQKDAVTSLLNDSGTVKERLRRALMVLVETDLADPGRRGCLATNSAVEFGVADADVATRVQSLFDHTERAFASLITEGRRSGELRNDLDDQAVASMLLNTVTGLHTLARLEKGPARMRSIADATISLL